MYVYRGVTLTHWRIKKMGATSVTGTSGDNFGAGSAEGKNKGSERSSLSVKKLIGPHVVVADSIPLVAGTATYAFPALPGVASDYVVHVSTGTANRAYASAFTTSSVTIIGTGTDVAGFLVCKKGVA